MSTKANWLIHLRNLFFPEVCPICEQLIKANEDPICLKCECRIPILPYAPFNQNPIEKLFYNNAPISGACAFLSFVENGIAQKLIHQIKYHGNKQLGYHLGTRAAYHLMNKAPSYKPELIIPIPLYFAREKKRGYNQAKVIAQGLSEVYQTQVSIGTAERKFDTQSQTKRDKYERFMNMTNVFKVLRPGQIKGKHILIVDDVITTGATTNSLCMEILKYQPKSLVVYALAFKV